MTEWWKIAPNPKRDGIFIVENRPQKFEINFKSIRMQKIKIDGGGKSQHSQMQFFVTFETFDQILRPDQRSTDPLQLCLVIIIDLQECHVSLHRDLILNLKKEDVGFFLQKSKNETLKQKKKKERKKEN